MKLSFVITNYKTPELLKLCLKSIKENVGLDYSIVVADGETEGEYAADLKGIMPGLRYLPFRKNVGFPVLANAGIERLKKENSLGDFVLTMNSDMIIPKGEVEKMVAYLEQNERIGALGPQLLYFSKKPQNSCFRFYRPSTIVYRRTFFGRTPWGKKELNRFLMNDCDKEKPQPVDWVMGSAIFIRKEVLEREGLMDEKRFFMYFEDVDWCRRFWEAGYQVVFYPLSNLYHYHGSQSKKKGLIDIFFNKYTWIHIKSAFRYFRKWGLKNPKFKNQNLK